MKKRNLVAGGVVALVAAGSLSGIAMASGGGGGGDENDQPITGDALTKASAAALAETGSGRVTQTEAGDEESYYQVEVTLDNGNQVDVQLDRDFHVVGSKTEGPENTNDGGDANNGD
jgi:hypothetical protein